MTKDPSGPVAALILAAGFSSRMGALKPLLPLGSGTVLAHVAATLRRGGVEDIVVVTGHRAEVIAAEAEKLGIRAVHNPNFASGMMTSVQAGITALAPEVRGTLLLPVDVPLVRPATIARLLAEAATGAPLILHPTFAGETGHPPYIGRALFAEILAAHGRLCDVFAEHAQRARRVPVFDEGCLTDMDTPVDYAVLRHRLSSLHVPTELECLSLLEAADVAPETRAHCHAVADLATLIGLGLEAAGLPVDAAMVRAGALLHDIAKGQDDHAAVGADILARHGFPEVGAIVARHMTLGFDGRLDEAAIVYLADKLISGTARVALEERFAPALKRFRNDPEALAAAHARFAEARAILDLVEMHMDLPEDPGMAAAPSATERLPA
jgi:putative nucleotidyltransferase with HDIG domain